MERWERTVDGRTEYWELEREAEALTEREGVAGAGPAVRETLCDTTAMAESVAARMAARRERAGFTRVSGAPESAPRADVQAPRPTYAGLTEERLDALANAVQKAVAGDAHKLAMAIHKVVGAWERRVPAAWFLVEHGLVPAERMPGLWDLLAEQPALVAPEALFALLTRLPTGDAFAKLYKYGPPPWFTEGFDRGLDELLFAAYQLRRDLFDAREAELPAPVRVALDLVRGRSGAPVAAERAQVVLRQIAKAQCEHGLASNWEMARVEGGAVARPRLADRHAVRAVALRFGSLDAWREAMAGAAVRAPELSVFNQYDGLAACPLADLASKLAGAFSFSTDEELALILALLGERADPPEALVDAASRVEGVGHHRARVRDMLAVLAAGRFGDAGRAVPEAVDALLDLSFFSGVYRASVEPYVKGMAALPRARALAFAERSLATDHGYPQGLAPLLAHPDDALLARIFDKDVSHGYLDPRVVGRFGAAALAHLARVWEATPRDRRRARQAQVLEALATAADRGETVDPSWARYIDFEPPDAQSAHVDPSYEALRARARKALRAG